MSASAPVVLYESGYPSTSPQVSTAVSAAVVSAPVMLYEGGCPSTSPQLALL